MSNDRARIERFSDEARAEADAKERRVSRWFGEYPDDVIPW